MADGIVKAIVLINHFVHQ